jgi:hypothetical protein
VARLLGQPAAGGLVLVPAVQAACFLPLSRHYARKCD